MGERLNMSAFLSCNLQADIWTTVLKCISNLYKARAGLKELPLYIAFWCQDSAKLLSVSKEGNVLMNQCYFLLNSNFNIDELKFVCIKKLYCML